MMEVTVTTVSSLMEHVGGRLRALREQRKCTLQELADQAGVSIGHISMIERGKGNPSFNTLAQIAHALGVPLAQLLLEVESPSPLVRSNERRPLDFHGSDAGSVHELLTPSLRNAMEAVWVEEPPGYNSEATPFQHPGEEFGFLFEGHHTVWLDGVPYELESGDSITYASTIPHWYSNRGNTVVKALWVITPPTF